MITKRKSRKQRREAVINISMTPEEKKIFLGLAEQRRQSVSEMLRQIVFREAGTTSKVA